MHRFTPCSRIYGQSRKHGTLMCISIDSYVLICALHRQCSILPHVYRVHWLWLLLIVSLPRCVHLSISIWHIRPIIRSYGHPFRWSAACGMCCDSIKRQGINKDYRRKKKQSDAKTNSPQTYACLIMKAPHTEVEHKKRFFRFRSCSHLWALPLARAGAKDERSVLFVPF